MNTDLKHAICLLSEHDFACVLCKDDVVLTDTAKGILPLVRWVDSGFDLKGFSAADKVVGKATAFLYALLKVDSVHAVVLSESALPILVRNNIKWSSNMIVPEILDRDGVGICPMEQTVANISDAQEALKQLKEKLKVIALQKRGRLRLEG